MPELTQSALTSRQESKGGGVRAAVEGAPPFGAPTAANFILFIHGYNVDKSNLEQMFAPHGTVVSAQVITDRDSGRSKGFGFVEMGSDQEAQAAIAALNGKNLEGRNLTVNEARPQEGRGGGGGRRPGGGGGYGGGGGGGGGRRY